jgi:hypothetical protein
VAFVRERWFAGESFSDDLVVLRGAAEHWSRDIAGARIHGTTRRVPREVFELEERAHLLPAPDAPFDVPRWTAPKVHPDHHVQVAQALYSVPTTYIGKKLRARADKKTVRLYFQGSLIKPSARRARQAFHRFQRLPRRQGSLCQSQCRVSHSASTQSR